MEVAADVGVKGLRPPVAAAAAASQTLDWKGWCKEAQEHMWDVMPAACTAQGFALNELHSLSA